MKADTTRSTFKQTKHYSGVLMQQGRVQLDADWNEQIDITGHRIETETIDVIGNCGAPMHDAGFHIVANANDLTAEEKKLPENQNPPALGANDLLISGGRYYVDGILCENDSIVAYTKQPDLPNPTAVNQAGTYLAYIDVWSRHMTAVEDPSIREVALGGPDTTTRSKTIWQVKLLRVGDANLNANCATVFQAWNDEIAAGTGKLAAKAATSAPSNDPCIVAPGAGYRRLENQHYRVEVHDKGSLGTATFKFSRDNGSIVTKWESQAVNDLTVSNAGRDDVLKFAAGNWVELSDDTSDLLSTPGTLVQLAKVEGNVLTINPASAIPAGPINIANFPMNPKVRRWDMAALVKPNNQNWLDLEAGVQVHFTNGTYKTGDYWLIPARTATADVEWPIDPSTNQPATQLPFGIKHHFCRLAILQLASGTWTKLSDCRNLFPPITELTSLFYISGDGQEALPDPGDLSKLLPLDQPLQAGVANGESPVANAHVQFTVKIGAGQLQATSGTGSSVIATTGADGVATCKWQLDSKTQNQQVEAVLLDATGNPVHLPVRFNANLSVASQVAYDPAKCANLSGARTIQDAIDILCQLDHSGKCCCVTVGKGGEFEMLDEAIKKLLGAGKTDICICLLPGEHRLAGKLVIADKSDQPTLCVRIEGCGPCTKVILDKAPIIVGPARRFQLKNLGMYSEFTHLLEIDGCEEVIVSGCELMRFGWDRAILAIGGAGSIRVTDNSIAAYVPNPPTGTIRFPSAKELRSWADLVDSTETLAEQFAALSPQSLKKTVPKILKAATDTDGATAEQKKRFKAIELAFRDIASDQIENRTAALFRPALLELTSGTALTITDANADVQITDNRIFGGVTLYGPTFQIASAEFTKLAQRVRDKKITINGSGHVAQIRGNILTGLFVSDSITKADPLGANVFSQMTFSENALYDTSNQALAQGINANANRFYSFPDSQVATVSGAFACVVGNSSETPQSLLLYGIPDPKVFLKEAANIFELKSV